MESVLISIHPKWCEKIASGRKTMELRKTKPKSGTPFKCYIYMTAGNACYPVSNNMVCNNAGCKRVIGEFICDNIMRFCNMQNADLAEKQSLVKREKIFEYANGREVFGWHISDLKIYEEPKEIGEFTRVDFKKLPVLRWKVERPPQSWCYVEEMDK